MACKLQSNNISFDNCDDDFADVYFHVEDKKTFCTVKANKVILALHSKYLLKLFQSVGKSETIHLHYKGVSKQTVKFALKVMYGEIVEIPNEGDLNRVVSFLKLLEIDFERTDGREGPVQKQRRISPDTEEDDTTKMDKNIPVAQAQMQAASATREDSCEDHKSSSASSKPVRITNRKGESVSLDNWTTTTFEDRDRELEDIGFKYKENENKRQHDFYVCRHCDFVSKEFNTAKEHFMNVHQNCDVEREIIREVFEHKKKAFNEINSLQIDIRNDKVNRKMAICSLQTIVDNLVAKVETLKGLKEKSLTPNLLFKRDEFIKSMNEAIEKVTRFINKSDVK